MNKLFSLIAIAGFLSILSFTGCARKCPCGAQQSQGVQPVVQKSAPAPVVAPAPAESQQYIK